MSTMSMLSRVGDRTLATDPFPHIVIDDALDADVYQALSAQFPTANAINSQDRPIENNHLYLLPANRVLQDAGTSPAYKEFFRYHVSNEFWRATLPLVKAQLLAIHPNLETIAGRRLEDFRTIMRQKDAEFAEEVALDCQFGINSPVTRTSSVRTPHVDRPNKLFNALLYCRSADDDSEGGELVLYRRIGPLVYSNGSAIMPTRIVEAKRIAYRANRLVLFLNSPWSVHGVAPRCRTPHSRRYLNFMAEFREPLFAISRLSRGRQLAELASTAISRRISGFVEADAEEI